MKKVFKVLFLFVVSITLFYVTDVFALVEVDEEKNEITYKAEEGEMQEDLNATYEIKDGILEVVFPELSDKQILSSEDILQDLVASFFKVTDILNYGNVYDFILSKDGIVIDKEDKDGNYIINSIKIDLGFNGRDESEVWNKIKETIKTISDSYEFFDEIKVDKVKETIKYGTTNLIYKIKDGIATITPTTSSDKLTSAILESILYAYSVITDNELFDLMNDKLADKGIDVEKIKDGLFSSLKIDLNKVEGSTPEESWDDMVEMISFSDDDIDIDTGDEEDNVTDKTDKTDNKKEDKKNDSTTGTVVKVGDTSVSYSTIALSIGIVCILIGVSVITVLVIKTKKESQ